MLPKASDGRHLQPVRIDARKSCRRCDPSPLRSILQLACTIAIAAAVPAGLCRWLDVPENLAGGERPAKEFDPVATIPSLARSRPDWILMGNSMLNSRIDNEPLADISGLKVRKVSKGGSQSALWFLFLKNVVIASKAKPAIVTIFFRDTDLTWPEFRIRGLNEELIATLRGPEQPEWQEVLVEGDSSEAGLQNWIRDGLSDLFPVTDLRPNARRSIQEKSFRATRIGTHMNSSGRRVELNQRFSLTHLRHDLGGDSVTASASQPAAAAANAGGPAEVIDPGIYEDGPRTFDPSPKASFLPHLVQLASQHGITLHFHRIKRRPGTSNLRPDDVTMQAYMKDLEAWLAAHHCVYTDESQDASLTLDMYADGDHISSEQAVQERYLKNFWARVGPLLKPLLAAQPSAEN